jgi:hypothetical protein
MAETKPVNKSPQIGVRFPPAEMERLREHAERNYAGNLSTLVKVAVRRLIESANDPEKKAA